MRVKGELNAQEGRELVGIGVGRISRYDIVFSSPTSEPEYGTTRIGRTDPVLAVVMIEKSHLSFVPPEPIVVPDPSYIMIAVSGSPCHVIGVIAGSQIRGVYDSPDTGESTTAYGTSLHSNMYESFVLFPFERKSICFPQSLNCVQLCQSYESLGTID